MMEFFGILIPVMAIVADLIAKQSYQFLFASIDMVFHRTGRDIECLGNACVRHFLKQKAAEHLVILGRLITEPQKSKIDQVPEPLIVEGVVGNLFGDIKV